MSIRVENQEHEYVRSVTLRPCGQGDGPKIRWALPAKESALGPGRAGPNPYPQPNLDLLKLYQNSICLACSMRLRDYRLAKRGVDPRTFGL